MNCITRRRRCRARGGASAAPRALAQKTAAHRLHRARDRPDQGLRGRLQQGQSQHRAQVGARLDRRHHRQAARREGQPAGRRGDGRGRVEPGAARQQGHAGALRAAQPRRDHEPQYRDKQNPPAWFGMDVWGATVCFNTVEAQKKGLPKPETWKDLTKPIYKGQIVMPNPASSGTGYLRRHRVAAACGATTARAAAGSTWTRCTRTSRSTPTRAPSPATWRAAGEFVIGISFEYRANTNKAKGAPIDLVFPKEGLGWDLEAFGIHKSTKKLEAAQKLADWASSKEAMALRQELRHHRAAGLATPLANMPTDYEQRLVKIDFEWPRTTASASSPSGPSATTRRARRRSRQCVPRGAGASGRADPATRPSRP